MRPRGVVAWLAAALVLSACGFKRPADVPDDGDVPDASDGSTGAIAECVPASGTQVKVVMRQHSDTSQQFVRLMDMATGRECRYVTAGDGKTRCMPFSDQYSDGFVAYSNSSCTSPILAIYTNRFYPGELFVGNDGGDGAGGTGGPFGLLGCGGQRRVFAVGNPIGDPQLIYVQDGLGNCVSQMPQTFIYDYFTAGAETPASTFVEGVPALIGDGRIQLEVTDGTDGSRFCRDLFSVFVDTSLRVACRPTAAYDDVPRCMPTSYPSSSYYTDANCSQMQTAAAHLSCRTESPYAAEFATSPCGNSVGRIREVGAPIGALYYRDSMNVCRATPSGITGYSLGNYVEDSQFASVILEYVPVGTRLERVDMVVDGARYPLGTWRDTMLQTECRFDTYQTAGQPRCTPLSTLEQPVANAWLYKVFTQAGCPQASQVDYAIVDKFTTTGCSPVQGPPRYVQKQDQTGYYEFFQVGTQVTGTFYYQYDPSSPCELVPATSTVYSIGAGITSQLVSGTEVQL